MPKDRLFPYQDMFNWLSYFNDPEHTSPAIIRKFWRNREFSFTLKDDIYVRYKSYKNLKEWKDDLRRKCPYKIDIGALYNIEPSRRSTISSDKFIAEEKELVFDIDISDYDDVRSCCKEAAICNKCWPLMCCAVDVMDRALREDFGLKHLLWVFSGRRGKIFRSFADFDVMVSHTHTHTKVFIVGAGTMLSESLTFSSVQQ